MSRLTLTFDNGPTESTTPYVLDVLQERGLHAYFCVVGSQLKRSAGSLKVAKETLQRGHRIVNHSLTHGVALGDDPSTEHAHSEVLKMDELMSETLGAWGEKWFRPFGRGGQIGQHIFSVEATRILQQLNYSVLMWNTVPRDWEDPKNWVTTALTRIEKQAHSVVVLHDLPTGAMTQLPRFLDEVDALGLKITLDLPADCVPMVGGTICDHKAYADLVADS